MIRFWSMAVALALLSGAAARADDDPPKSPADQLKQLKKDVADAQRKAMEINLQARKAKDEDEKKKLNDQFQKEYSAFLKFQRNAQDKAIAMAKADPKSAVGFDAALWALPALRTNKAERKAVIDLIMEHHADSKDMGQVVGFLAVVMSSDAGAIDTIEAIAAKSPHKSVKAASAYTIADFYKNKAEPYGRPAPKDADELAKKAEDGFENVLKEHGNEIQFRNRTYGEAAKAALFELRNLRVGKTAPEIDGEDVDGAKFKLSDYRGKVVMLDFWGHW